MNCRNFLKTTAICMPNRTSIMTGIYERMHGGNFNTADLNPRFWRKSYPVLLQQQGYYTGFTGKFGFAVCSLGIF